MRARVEVRRGARDERGDEEQPHGGALARDADSHHGVLRLNRDPRIDDAAVGEVEVVIDTPRGGRVKRRDDGGIDFVSPVGCPYNYGSVPDTRAGDGDRVDAIVLGAPLTRGARVRRRVIAIVRFRDEGADDPKLVCGEAPLEARERAGIERFFRIYARAKRVLARVRGRSTDIAFVGIEEGSR